ncbi:hypothetical protein A4S06_00925 [Erysipelotrichaceae bacterium MTC7]|nr:hypothetical protein A4S06_00925 [Erysipelotrichaceae bacterium MTC7]
MNSSSKAIQKMVISAMLIAVGIIIPMFSPIKVVIEPASFTLASHVAIMIGMFISPGVTVAVAIGTTIGFLLGGFPITVVARAGSHIVFALIGALYFAKKPEVLNNPTKCVLAFFVLSLIHAVCEVLVVLPIYLNGAPVDNFFYLVFGLVGVGTVIHSMIDFIIARAVYQLIPQAKAVRTKLA